MKVLKYVEQQLSEVQPATPDGAPHSQYSALCTVLQQERDGIDISVRSVESAHALPALGLSEGYL